MSPGLAPAGTPGFRFAPGTTLAPAPASTMQSSPEEVALRPLGRRIRLRGGLNRPPTKPHAWPKVGLNRSDSRHTYTRTRKS